MLLHYLLSQSYIISYSFFPEPNLGFSLSIVTLSFLSIVFSERYMTKHSSILIHQLSGSTWGTYEQMKDHFTNSTFLQKQIRDIYLQYSN